MRLWCKNFADKIFDEKWVRWFSYIEQSSSVIALSYFRFLNIIAARAFQFGRIVSAQERVSCFCCLQKSVKENPVASRSTSPARRSGLLMWQYIPGKPCTLTRLSHAIYCSRMFPWLPEQGSWVLSLLRASSFARAILIYYPCMQEEPFIPRHRLQFVNTSQIHFLPKEGAQKVHRILIHL